MKRGPQESLSSTNVATAYASATRSVYRSGRAARPEDPVRMLKRRARRVRCRDFIGISICDVWNRTRAIRSAKGEPRCRHRLMPYLLTELRSTEAYTRPVRSTGGRCNGVKTGQGRSAVRSRARFAARKRHCSQRPLKSINPAWDKCAWPLSAPRRFDRAIGRRNRC